MRPSQNIPLHPRIYPLLNFYMRPSQNIPLPPRTYLLFHYYMRPSQNLHLPPSIYPLLNIYIRPSQNIPLPPTIYSPPPPFRDYVRCLRIPESTPSSHNLPFHPRIYPLFHNYIRHSHNLPFLPEYTPFYTAICDVLRIYPRMYPPFKHIYATLLEYTSLSHNIGLPPIFHSYMRQSQNLPLPPRIYPLLYKVTLSESTPPS